MPPSIAYFRKISHYLNELRGIPTSYFVDPQDIFRRIQIGEILPAYVDRYLADILPIK
jgi:hypothetical protein